MARALRAGEGARLLGEEEAGAVDEVDDRQAQAQGHLLGALDLLGCARPPGAGGDGVVVGDDDDPALVDLGEAGDDTGSGRLLAGEVLAIVHEGPDLAHGRALVLQGLDALAGCELALGVDAVDVLLAPAAVDLRAALFEEVDALG